MYFLEIIVVRDLKDGIFLMQTTNWANEGMGVFKVKVFLALAQFHLHIKIKTCFSQEQLVHVSQILHVNF